MSKAVKSEFIRAQVSLVESMMAKLTPSNIVERISLTSRHQALVDELTSIEAECHMAANVVLFFDGEPVYGQQGIDASFSAPAIMHYEHLVSRIARKFAKPGRGNVGRMMMTDIVHGSLGIELQEVQETTVESPMSFAIEHASTLMELATKDDEEALVNAMEGVDADAQTALRKFLGALKTHGATLRIVSGKSEHSFERNAVVSAHARLMSLRPREYQAKFVGTYGSTLPYKRTFDFKPKERSPITGIVSPQIDMGVLYQYSFKECTAHVIVSVRRVKKSTQETYRLIGVDDYIVSLEKESKIMREEHGGGRRKRANVADSEESDND